MLQPGRKGKVSLKFMRISCTCPCFLDENSAQRKNLPLWFKQLVKLAPHASNLCCGCNMSSVTTMDNGVCDVNFSALAAFPGKVTDLKTMMHTYCPQEKILVTIAREENIFFSCQDYDTWTTCSTATLLTQYLSQRNDQTY